MPENPPFDPLAAHMQAQHDFYESHEPPDRHPGRAHEIVDLDRGLRIGEVRIEARYEEEPPPGTSIEISSAPNSESGPQRREIRLR